MPVEVASSQDLIRVFFYGTLKRNQPNEEHLLNKNITFVSEAVTADKWPLLVASEFNVPFLLDHKGVGKVRNCMFQLP
jgi:gamma-glutamylaminecyclotransferase